METTVTISLKEFDSLRERAEKGDAAREGMKKFQEWLKNKSSSTSNPYNDWIWWPRNYNESNPEYPFIF